MIFNRRRFLALAAGGISASTAFPRLSLADNPPGRPLHGLSAFGDLKYAKDFDHFDYANPDAPVGGIFTFQPAYWYRNQNTQTFNTLNAYVLRGDAPPRMEHCFDSLMVEAWDEPDAVYCHLAESVRLSDDGNRFTFRLRDIARWHDGGPITAQDVAWTYTTLKNDGHPELALPLGPMVEAVAEDELTVSLVFDGTQSAQDLLAIAVYPVLSKSWYANVDFNAASMIPPPGSGPYKVGRVEPGLYIEYERVADYWARDLGTAKGLGHFQTIHIDFYKERLAAFEAFKKGDITFREEFTSKTWSTEYNFPAVLDGRVTKRTFEKEARPYMSAWALNTRRKRFADIRVRDAIGLCFDFEWTNQNLFYGAYERSQSTFAGSPYEATGLPGPDELALIAEIEAIATLPGGIRGEAHVQPVADGTGRDRERLREATRLLSEAGWSPGAGGMLRNDAGESLDVEFLIQASVFERVYGPYVEIMRMLGINASLRLVDPAQYAARTDTFDFDMVGMALSWSATPTASSLETIFASKSATVNGTRNYPGSADPAVDALISRVGKAKTREEHRTAMLVLDRVLRLKREWIPSWTSANHRVAYWDMFGFAETKPDYFWPVELLWWVDDAKAKALGKT